MSEENFEEFIRGYGLYYHDPDELGEDAFKRLSDDEVQDILTAHNAHIVSILKGLKEEANISFTLVGTAEPGHNFTAMYERSINQTIAQYGGEE